MASEQLERGLQASVKVYNFALERIGALGDATECVVTRKELTDMKKAAAAMNRSLTALVRESHEAENRLTLELHMLRGIMRREHTDRDANRARVFELFRRYTCGGGGGGGGGSNGDDAQLPTTSAGSANPLNAPSASAMALDRALATLERIDQSTRDLSPVGRVNVHGAGLLSAKRKLEAAAEAVPAPTTKRTKA
jgi:hypothetical protein